MTRNFNLTLDEITENLVIVTITDEDGNKIFEFPFKEEDLNIIHQVSIGLSSYFNPESQPVRC